MTKRLKIYWIILTLSVVTLLQGCAFYYNVKVDGEEALKKYAQKENGEFDFISFEHDQDRNENMLTVKDKDTEVVYKVVSYPVGIGGSVDGEWFFYRKHTESTYPEEYRKYIVRLIDAELNDKYGIRVLDVEYTEEERSNIRGKCISFLQKEFITGNSTTYERDMEAIRDVMYQYNIKDLGFEGKYDVYVVKEYDYNVHVTNYRTYDLSNKKINHQGMVPLETGI